MRVYLPFEIQHQHRSTFNKLLERFGLEYSDLIDITCKFWEISKDQDRELLLVELENILVRHMRHDYTYRAILRNILILEKAIGVIQEQVAPALDEVRETYYCLQPVKLRLAGWAIHAPVIEILPISGVGDDP